MARITVVLSVFSIILSQSVMAEIIAVGGKPYQIMPHERIVCGERGSPEYSVAFLKLESSRGIAEAVYKASCNVGSETKCSPIDIKRAGVAGMFTSIRQFPSYTRSGCKDLRDECENTCKDSKTFDEKTCVVECNQYETWNR